MSEDGNRTGWIQPAVAFGFITGCVSLLSGYDGALAKLEQSWPYVAPFVGTVVWVALGSAIFRLAALAWRPSIRWRNERRRDRTEEANKAAAQRAEMDAKRDIERLRLLEETVWLYSWVKEQVDGGFRTTNPLETERVSLIREKLVDEGLLDSWATVNLDVVSREMVAELAKVTAHLEKFPIPEAVARLRRS